MTLPDTNRLPKPIIINCIKHHLGHIINRIKVSKQDAAKNGYDHLLSELLLIGQSRIDLYTGGLDPYQICNYVNEQLKEQGHYTKIRYKKWVAENKKDYQLMKIPDQSIWTFLIGEDSKRYIHIHPARISPYNISVYANGLKSAIAVVAWTQIYGGDAHQLTLINDVRKTKLKIPPIKKYNPEKGLGKLINLLQDELILRKSL